jgi:hypothetical protein
MTKSPENDEKKQIEQTKSIMAKLAAMPHKPHVKKAVKKTSEKKAKKD